MGALFSFEGRVRRGTFWVVIPLVLLLQLAAVVLMVVGSERSLPMLLAGLALSIPSAWIGVANCVKRSHDMDRSGLLGLALLIPLAGIVPAVILGIRPGSVGTNQYGPDPGTGPALTAEGRFFILLAVITGVAVTLGTVTWPEKKPVGTVVKDTKDRQPAPDFELKDVNGKVVHLSDYKGKVVLLDFWATWCGPCAIEIPWFTDFQRTFKDRGFTVLGVAMDDGGWKDVKPFVAEKKINYQVVLGDDKTSDRYGDVEALPTTFVIDREGRIASVHVGLVDKKEFADAIQKLL